MLRCSGAQCSGVRVFGCSGVRVFGVNDIFEGQKGDQGSAPKWPKFNMGRTGHLQEGGKKMAKILGDVKFEHFGPSLRPKKCFQQLTKWGQIDEKLEWGQNSIWGKTGHTPRCPTNPTLQTQEEPHQPCFPEERSSS